MWKNQTKDETTGMRWKLAYATAVVALRVHLLNVAGEKASAKRRATAWPPICGGTAHHTLLDFSTLMGNSDSNSTNSQKQIDNQVGVE